MQFIFFLLYFLLNYLLRHWQK